MPFSRRVDHRVGEVELGAVERGLRALHRSGAARPEIGIAAELGEDVGDVALRRGDLLARHLHRVLRPDRSSRCEATPDAGELASAARIRAAGRRAVSSAALASADFLAVGRLQRLDLQPRGGELRLGFLDRDAVRPVVEPKQHLACVTRWLSCTAISTTRPEMSVLIIVARRLDIGVVGRDVAAAGQVPPAGAEQHDDRAGQHQRQAQPLAQRARGARRRRRGRRRRGESRGPAPPVRSRSSSPAAPRRRRTAAADGAGRAAARPPAARSRLGVRVAAAAAARARRRWRAPAAAVRSAARPPPRRSRASASSRVSFATFQMRPRIGRALSVRNRRRARRSAGSGRRSIQPASSMRSICRTSVIGLISSRSARPAWLIPSLRAR